MLVLAVIFCAVYFSGNIESSSSDSYSIANLKKDLGNGNVTSASISQNQEIPTGEVVVKLKSGKNVDFYVSDVKDVQELLDQWNVSYKLGDVKKTSWVITTLLRMALVLSQYFAVFISVCTICKFRRRKFKDDEFWKKQSQKNRP